MSKTINIECPVCNSGNTFITERAEKLSCEDCGFLFAENSHTTPGACLICGSRSFYYFSPFNLSFLGRDSVCYVCEAHYRKVQIGNPDRGFSEESFARAEQSDEARRLKDQLESLKLSKSRLLQQLEHAKHPAHRDVLLNGLKAVEKEIEEVVASIQP